MFSRIRYAAKVLSYSPPKPSKFDEPDIVFEEESLVEPNKFSKAVGTFIEVFVVSIAVGTAAFPIAHFLFPAKETAHLTTIAGIAAAFLSILGYKLLDKVNAFITVKLKIGETIAPFFGHKIVRAARILKG